MFLKVNGKSVDINDGAQVSDLLDMLEIPKTKVADERNGIVIPNSQLLTTTLEDEDVLEIARGAIGGVLMNTAIAPKNKSLFLWQKQYRKPSNLEDRLI